MLVPRDQREHVEPRAHVEKMEYLVPREKMVVKGFLAGTELMEKRDHMVMWDPQDHQDSLVHEDPPVQPAVQEQMDQREIPVCQVLLDSKDHVVSRAPPELTENADLQDKADPRESGARQDQLVFKGHKVYQEKGDHQEDAVFRDHRVTPAQPGSRER